MKTVLFPFQREGVDRLNAFLSRQKGALLADSMGLGKTIQILTVLQQHPELRPAVIVCPASIKGVWEQQASQHLNMRVEVLSGRKPGGVAVSDKATIILNYDILEGWLPWLKELKPKIVVGDEIHYCQSRGAIRTRAMKELVSRAEKFIAASGTPLTNRVSELWPVLNMIDPEEWPSFTRFVLRYTHRRRTPWGWDYSRPRDLPALHRLLTERLMIRRLKSEVLKDLPAKTKNVVPIKLPDHKMKEYNAAEKDFRRWVTENLSRSQAMRTLRAEAVTKVGHLKRLCAKLKLKQMIEWVSGFLAGSDEKIILFAVHRKVIDAVKAKFKGCAVVTGDVTGQERTRQFRKFNTDKKCRVFAGNIQAAGVGWSAKCSNVTFLELPWTPSAVSQASDRIHGIGRGQEGKVSTVHFLLAAGTIEDRICAMLDRKQKTFDEAMDGGRGHEKLDLLDELLGSFVAD